MSLAAQEARIRAWARRGAEVVETIADAGVSGSKALADRPGGARVAALLDSRKPEADAIAILRLDRLGRDAAESLALLKRFRTSKVGLVSVADRLDLGTPQGRAMAGMAAVFAELEKALGTQRTTDVVSELRRQGMAWNHTPFGWDVVEVKVDEKVEKRLVPVESEQDTLRRIRELRKKGLAYNKVASILNTEVDRPSAEAPGSQPQSGPWCGQPTRLATTLNEHTPKPPLSERIVIDRVEPR